MNAKNQRQSDPFAALQRDINQLGMIHYNKAKKAKEKAKKQKLSRQAKIKKAERSKENSFINQQNQYPKLPSLYQNNNGVLRKLPQINNPLLQRIKQFQNRINSLELQNNIQKKQNQKLIQHVAGLRIKNKTSNSLYQQQIPPQYPQPFPYSPFMSPMVNPMLNPMMPMMNPYQMPFQQQTPINNQQSKTSYQKKKKFSPLSMFRIAGYVVFFSLFFKKFAKTFTIHRFDKFKQDWLGQQAIPRARQNLIEYFRQNIELQIFDRRQIKDLDSLHNIAEEKKKKKKKIKKKIMKNQKKQTESSQSSEDDDQSDQQEQKYSRTQNAKSNVFQFYLKIDIAVAFVIQFVKQINRILVNEDFQQNNPFLVLLLPRQFQPDYLHEQGDFKYLNIHPTKGYSQHEKIFSQYLLIKNIYLTIFVQKGLLNELAGKFYFKIKKGSKVKQNKVFFSFFIRSTILKTMIESYLAKKIKKLKQYNLPKLESRPFLKKNFEHQALKSQFVSLENEGIDMREQSIQQISKQQTKKREIQFRALLDEGCQILMNKVFALRKKLLNELKQQVFAQQQKYRVQKDNYFKLHERQDFARKIPTKQSISKSSVPISSSYGSIQSDKISINQRIKSNKYPLKANKQTLKSNTKNKTQKQQPKQTTKTLEQQQQQQQEQEEDSDDD